MSPDKSSSKSNLFHCPGDTCDIAAHICQARQRRGYPPCKQCRSGSVSSVTPAVAPSSQQQLGSVLDKIVKAYDIRGSYPEQVNVDIAWKLGYATADYLLSELSGYARAQSSAKSVAVGRDMRIGSPELSEAFIDGVLCAGADCTDVGMIDSPQLYFAVNFLGTCGGAQITASHNPAGDNGFKIAGQGARPIGGDSGLDKIKALAAAAKKGMIRDRARGKLSHRDLTADYKKHVMKFAGHIAPLQVVIDASNGMAGRFVPLLFGDLPITITSLNFEHDGHFIHPPNPLIEENLESLKKTVICSKAHLGVCFDGDADRCAFVDEKGQSIRPDLVTAILAKEFLSAAQGATVVYDLRSSHVVPEIITQFGGIPRRERIGHAFMKHAMADSGAIFGGELSGHYYYRDNWFCDSGFITFVIMLTALSQANIPLSKLIQPTRKYAHSGEINFEVQDKQAVLDALVANYRKLDKAKIDMRDGVTVELDKYWFNVRPSNTEPKLRLNLEASSLTQMKSLVRELADFIQNPAKPPKAKTPTRKRQRKA